MIVVDRIEGARAVLEFDGEIVEVPASSLPAGACEGAVLSLSLSDDAAALAEARARQERLAAKHDLPDEIEL
ncbi:MAG: DUF3006 domain-containing protein [Alphaproteobacteria bacterium]|nr:DUF3006 domain-containing protein [Alphaproteobacteria bacterium]